jgi:nitrite reductase/ring-hydroxylating ferredoxin subunit
MGADGAPAADRVTYLQEAARAAARYLREETYAATRRPVEEARTLLPDAYRDPAFHALEQERLFTTSWVGVAFADRVAETGQVVTATVADQPIMITRDPTGALRAFHNVCRHRGTQLVEADTRVKRFRCPYHSWTYALNGRLVGIPGSPHPLTGVDDFGAYRRANARSGGFVSGLCASGRPTSVVGQIAAIRISPALPSGAKTFRCHSRRFRGVSKQAEPSSASGSCRDRATEQT